MKTKYLLSALAISAAFVACDKDEQMQVNNTMNTNKNEIVGEELLGSGLSMGLISHEEGQTRATADGKWELGDVAGLGWLVKDNPYASQTGATLAEVDAKLFNNHYYAYQGEGKWNTQGNIYKGWHFAYFPYQYHEEVQALTFTGETLNPAFTMLNAGVDHAYKADIYSNAPHISAAAFLDKSKVNTLAGTIKESFSIERVVNVFIPVLKFSNEFKEEALKDLAITEIKWNVGTSIFPTKLDIDPTALTQNQYTEDEKLDENATRELLISNLYAVGAGAHPILKTSNYSTNVKTKLTDAEGNSNFTLGNAPEVGHYLRMFMPPAYTYTLTPTPETFYFEVTVQGGHKFVVNETTDSEAYAKLLKLIGEKNNGVLRKISSDGKTVNGAQGVVFNLGVKHFVYNNVISEENTWENCVAIADALGLDNPTFKIADGYTLEFDDAEKMLAPKKGITVAAEGANATLKIVGTTAWNNAITIDESVTVEVANTGVLSVNDESLKSIALVNNGNINAGELSTIGSKQDTEFVNNGTVTIKYGALIYPATSSKGYIAYKLLENDGVKVVNTLLKGGKDGAANVNKFIVENRVWDLDETIEGTGVSGDRYEIIEGTDATEYAFTELEKVTLEIINATVKGYVTFPTFKDVFMEGESSSLTGVYVTNNLNVTGGGVVDCRELNNVTSDGDIKASIINGDVVAVNVDAASVGGEIEASGAVKVKILASKDVTAKSVDIYKADGNVTATEGDVILNQIARYKSISATGNVTVNNGDVEGNITAGGDITVKGMILNNAEVVGVNITAEHIVGNVTASGNVTITSTESGLGIIGDVTAVDINNAPYIRGTVSATNINNVGKIEGDVTVAGNVTVTESIDGSLTWDAEKVVDGETVTVDCPSITGDVTAEGKMTVNATKTNIGGTLTVGNGVKSNGTTFNLGVSGSPEELTIANIKVHYYSTLNIFDKVTSTKIDNDGTITVKKNALLITGFGGYVASSTAKLNGSVTYNL